MSMARLAMEMSLGTGSPRGMGLGGLFSLFSNGERGFLFDQFSDQSRLFTTSRGDVQVANDLDPVGLALDRSKWGGKSYVTILGEQLNKVRNPGATGGTAGTPGVPPTHWSVPSMPGITPQNLGLTTVNGILGLAVRYQGTTSGAGFNSPAVETRDSIPATIGSFWRFSVYLALLAGSLNNITNLTVRIGQNNSAFNYVAEVGSGNNVKAVINDTPTRYVFSGVADNAQLATVQPYIQTPNSSAGQAIDFTLFIALPEMVVVPGVQGWQHTNISWRPFWRFNGGRPYWQLDGADDRINTFMRPTPALTVALGVRFNSAAGAKFALGGGTLADRRIALGISTDGKPAFGWGANNLTVASSPAITGQDVVMLATGDAANRQFWLNNALLDSGTPSGLAFNETGDGIVLGGYSTGGVVSNFADCRIYSGLALNRKVTPAEIATITNLFRSAYQ